MIPIQPKSYTDHSRGQKFSTKSIGVKPFYWRDWCNVANSRYTSLPPFPNVSSCEAVQTRTGMKRAGCLTEDLLPAGPVRPERGWPRKPRDAITLTETKNCRIWLAEKKNTQNARWKNKFIVAGNGTGATRKYRYFQRSINRFRTLFVKMYPVWCVSKEINIKSEC